MKASNYNRQEVRLQEDSPMFMENFERKHIEQVYKSTKDELLCWGEESSYFDSEFSTTLERKEMERPAEENYYGSFY